MTSPADLLKGTTPGPWKIGLIEDGCEITAKEHSPFWLAQTHEPNAKANARLIAAAPDLARLLGEAEDAIAKRDRRLAEAEELILWKLMEEAVPSDGKTYHLPEVDWVSRALALIPDSEKRAEALLAESEKREEGT